MGSISAMAAWHKSFSSTGPKRQCPEERSCADPCIPANQGPYQDLLPKRTVPWNLPPSTVPILVPTSPQAARPCSGVLLGGAGQGEAWGGPRLLLPGQEGFPMHRGPAQQAASSSGLPSCALRELHPGSSPGLCHTPTTKGPA